MTLEYYIKWNYAPKNQYSTSNSYIEHDVPQNFSHFGGYYRNNELNFPNSKSLEVYDLSIRSTYYPSYKDKFKVDSYSKGHCYMDKADRKFIVVDKRDKAIKVAYHNEGAKWINIAMFMEMLGKVESEVPFNNYVVLPKFKFNIKDRVYCITTTGAKVSGDIESRCYKPISGIEGYSKCSYKVRTDLGESFWKDEIELHRIYKIGDAFNDTEEVDLDDDDSSEGIFDQLRKVYKLGVA